MTFTITIFLLSYKVFFYFFLLTLIVLDLLNALNDYFVIIKFTTKFREQFTSFFFGVRFLSKEFFNRESGVRREYLQEKLVKLGKDVDLDVVYENNIKLVNEMSVEDPAVKDSDEKEASFVEDVKNK